MTSTQGGSRDKDTEQENVHEQGHAEKTEELLAESTLNAAVSASASASTEEQSEYQQQSHYAQIETPSISMSAGQDPWADPPPVASMEKALSTSKRPTRDNPWAIDTPDLGTEASTMSSVKEVIAISSEGELNTSGMSASHQDDRWGELHLPKLGNSLARYWSFKPGLLQLNNGSYGACPKPVTEAYKALQDRQEENIDMFRHSHLIDMLADSRTKVAKILNCRMENLVLVNNASLGTNAVLRDLVFQHNDAILYFSLTYGAVVNNIDYLVDMERIRGKQLNKVKVSLNLPLTKESMLEALRASIKEAKDQGKQIVVGVIDTISSKPAIRMPWEEMVGILKEHQILSLVDGAHGIGHIPINLTAADPDFFVSNCHKWLYAHRGCAVLYVASRNLHLQRSSLPTSWSYLTSPNEDNNTWALQWASPGTVDASPFLSVDAAIEFRQMLGGEERIMNYNLYLALKGGAAAAKILDTCVLEPVDADLTCCMTNVQLPIIKSRVGSDADAWINAANSWFFLTLQQEFKCTLNLFAFQGKIWARFSAQIWLEVSDFEYGARALLEVCNRVNQGIAPDFLAQISH